MLAEMKVHRLGALSAKVVWLAAMMTAFVWWVGIWPFGAAGAAVDGDGSEHILLGATVLIALTFPLGLLWALLVNVLAYMLSAAKLTNLAPDWFVASFYWLGLVAVGYFQWFWLLPRAWGRAKNSLANRRRDADRQIQTRQGTRHE
jgi:hypothetical protein